MEDPPQQRSGKYDWVANLVFFGGLAAITFATINSEHKVTTAVVGIVLLLVSLTCVGLLMDRGDGGTGSPSEKDQTVNQESEVLGNWSDRARERKRTGKTMVGGSVPPFPEHDSSSADREWPELAGFPTFRPHEIRYDESIPEDELEDDTLLFDSTGHGVDLEDGLFEEGLSAAFELLELDESEWSMRPWGYEALFAIEAIAAAAGQPSRSRELGRLRAWSKRVSYKVNPELVEEMLGRIDSYMEAVRENPEKRDVVPEATDQIEGQASKMRDRIGRLLA